MDKKELSQNEDDIKETWPTCSKCNTNPVERCSRRNVPYHHGLCVLCRKQQKRIELKREIEAAIVSENRAFPKELIENHPWLKNTIRDINSDYDKYVNEMPEVETEHILNDFIRGFQTALSVSRRDKIKSLGGTKYSNTFYNDAGHPYELLKKLILDMEGLIERFCNRYTQYMQWLNEDKDDGFVMTKRLMLNEMVRCIPVEIQDQAIDALQGVIETNTINQAAQETAMERGQL